MQSPDSYIIDLIVRDIQECFDPADRPVLEAWLAADPEHRAFYDRMMQKRTMIMGVVSYRRASGRRKEVRKRVLDKVTAELAGQRVRVRPLKVWIAWTAAACILLLGSGVVFLDSESCPQ